MRQQLASLPATHCLPTSLLWPTLSPFLPLLLPLLLTRLVDLCPRQTHRIRVNICINSVLNVLHTRVQLSLSLSEFVCVCCGCRHLTVANTLHSFPLPLPLHCQMTFISKPKRNSDKSCRHEGKRVKSPMKNQRQNHLQLFF